MTDEGFLRAPVEVIICDGTLDLADVQAFARSYPALTGNDVHVISRWGGPAASPVEWAGPEVAVVVVIAYDLLKHLTSDAYEAVKRFLLESYRKIRTRTGAKWYTKGAVAIALENRERTLRVLCCLPEGLGSDELKRNIERIERDASNLLAQWESVDWFRLFGRSPYEVKVTWQDDECRWRPSPGEHEATLRAFGIIEA